jgi:hypothetical protein
MVTKLGMVGLAGPVACMGFLRNYTLCRSEKLNGRENSTQILVHISMEDVSWEYWT